jgi:TetR/AcrR family transcriptional repressor of nem operon
LPRAGNYRDRLLAYYQQTLNQFCQQGIISGCLTVKLSAECAICQKICAQRWIKVRGIIALLAQALEKGQESLSDLCWRAVTAGAGTLFPVAGRQLQAKISRSACRWKMRWPTLKTSLQRLPFNRRFYFPYY